MAGQEPKTALERAFRDFKWADGLLSMAAARAGGTVGDTFVLAVDRALEVRSGNRHVLSIQLAMPRSADPSEEQWWTWQLCAAHAVLEASEPDPRAD